jgi:hypothetical protein
MHEDASLEARITSRWPARGDVHYLAENLPFPDNRPNGQNPCQSPEVINAEELPVALDSVCRRSRSLIPSIERQVQSALQLILRIRCTSFETRPTVA